MTVTNDKLFYYTDRVEYSFDMKTKEGEFYIAIHTDMTVRVYRSTAYALHGWFHGTFINGRVSWSVDWTPVGLLTPQVIGIINRKLRLWSLS